MHTHKHTRHTRQHTPGVKCLLEDEAVAVGGSNHSHATQDLYDAIAAGDYPEWTLAIQTMDPADQDKCARASSRAAVGGGCCRRMLAATRGRVSTVPATAAHTLPTR
jgi:hypothetical protein